MISTGLSCGSVWAGEGEREGEGGRERERERERGREREGERERGREREGDRYHYKANIYTVCIYIYGLEAQDMYITYRARANGATEISISIE